MNTLAALGMDKIFDKFDISGTVYSFVSAAEKAFTGTKQMIKTWVKNSNGRKELARLSPRMLRDIGLEPYQVQSEINKPFWRS